MIMKSRTRKVLTTIPLFTFIACTGATLGENDAGQDTYLEPWDFHDSDDGTGREVALGSIGVDHITETAYVVQSVLTRDDETNRILSEEKTLFAIPPDGSAPSGSADLSHLSDLRILFPGDTDVLVLGELDGVDHLGYLDPSTLELRDVLPALNGARYHGTRLSPSRRYMAVADNNVPETPPIHVVDLQTRRTEVIPHDGFWLEAMWLRNSDTLFTVIFYNDDEETEDVDETRARVVSFPMSDLEACGFQLEEDGVWCGRGIDVEIAGGRPDFFFSFTWLGIAPDDRVVAVPQRGDGMNRLALVDTFDGTVRIVDDARGPVGFTPDGTTVVSYRYTVVEVPCPDEDDSDPETTCPPDDQVPQLALIDVEDLTVATIDLPTIEMPSYFVTRTGNLVVVADAWDGGRLVVADLDTGDAIPLDGPEVNLREIVSLDDAAELWIADDGLFRVDLLDATVRLVLPELTPLTINVLPQHNRLVIDDGEAKAIVFVDPDAQIETARAVLPMPEP